MGKGKGGSLLAMLRFYPGKPFIEVSNIRLGALMHFTKYLGFFLSNTIILFTNNQQFFSNKIISSFFLK